MRRALTGAAACLLLFAAAAMIAGHLRLRQTKPVVLSAPEAALRADMRMSVEWPQGDIDPNTADAQELEALSGVGPSLALRILEEREANGPFLYPEDLLSVRGIGLKTLACFRQQLRFSFPTNQ